MVQHCSEFGCMYVFCNVFMEEEEQEVEDLVSSVFFSPLSLHKQGEPKNLFTFFLVVVSLSILSVFLFRLSC